MHSCAHELLEKSCTFLLFIFLFICMGFNYDNADYDSYQSMYYASKYFDYNIFDYMSALQYGYSRDPGFALLNKIFLEMGFSYDEFKCFITLLSLIMLFLLISKFVKNEWKVIVIYLMYPFFMDIIQFRNFLVEVLLIFALYLYLQGGKYKYFKYIGCLLFGATIHNVAIVYIGFLVYLYIKKFRIGTYIIYFFILIGIMLPLYAGIVTEQLAFLGMLLSDGTSIEHFTQYLDKSMNYGYLIPYGYILMATIVMRIINISEKNESNAFNKEYIAIVYQLFLYLSVLLPIFAINGNLIRIPRNLMILFYIALIYYINMTKKNTKWCLFAIAVLGSFILGMVDLYYPDSTAFNMDLIFNKNYIFEFF